MGDAQLDAALRAAGRSHTPERFGVTGGTPERFGTSGTLERLMTGTLERFGDTTSPERFGETGTGTGMEQPVNNLERFDLTGTGAEQQGNTSERFGLKIGRAHV